MSKKFWMSFRQALLMIIDALERELGHKPRTAQLRKFHKDWRDNKS